jgi:hypothetical protein
MRRKDSLVFAEFTKQQKTIVSKTENSMKLTEAENDFEANKDFICQQLDIL